MHGVGQYPYSVEHRVGPTLHGHTCILKVVELVWWEDWENTQELILFQKPRVGHVLIYIKHKESPVVQSHI